MLSQLAVLKCAAIYVPLDINAPQERQTFMVQDSQAVLVLTYSTETLDSGTQRLDRHPASEHGAGRQPESRGLRRFCGLHHVYLRLDRHAQGVLVPHRAISRLVIDNGYADFNGQDRVAFASNPAFDASTLDVWAPLLNGGCVIVAEQSVLLSQEAFRALLLAQSVSVLWLTAGLFHQYADGLMEVFAGLRYLIVGGDVLDPAVIARVLARARRNICSTVTARPKPRPFPRPTRSLRRTTVAFRSADRLPTARFTSSMPCVNLWRWACPASCT